MYYITHTSSMWHRCPSNCVRRHTANRGGTYAVDDRTYVYIYIYTHTRTYIYIYIYIYIVFAPAEMSFARFCLSA